jgi:hypothetical protein
LQTFLQLHATTYSDASGNTYSAYVDLYNATSNNWVRYVQGLGQARSNLAAASLSSGLVFFAGGETTGTSDLASAMFALRWLGYGLLIVLRHAYGGEPLCCNARKRGRC